MNHEEWIITVPDENTETRDWSGTCTDILSLFIARLGPVEHLKFGCVCHSWRSARSEHASVRSPLLLLPKPFFARTCNFVSPVNTRIHSLVVSELFACRVIGAFSKSWLIIRRFPHVFLYNPFTFAKIMLPISFYLYLPRFAAASLSSPEFKVLTYSLNCFHSFRVGDRKWLRHRYDNSMGEILQMSEVGGKFYVLTNQGNLGLVDVNDSPVLVWLDKITFEVRSYSYIVDSDGELLIVLVAVLGNDFKFYKLDSVTSKLVPTEMRKDEVLYLGMKSVAMRKKGESRVYTVGPSEIGMFDFSTGKGKVFCDRSCALWMMPELMVRERKPSRWMLCQNLLWLVFQMLIIVSVLVFAVIGAVLLFSLALICGLLMLLNYLTGLLRWYHLWIVMLLCICIAAISTFKN